MLRRIGLAGLVLFSVQGACGGADPPPRPAARHAAEAPSPDSAEWLYATENAKGGRKGECTQVLEALQGETRCKQALCRKGERLAKDWLLACKKLLPDDVADVEQIKVDLAERAGQSPTKCEEEYVAFMAGGCKKSEDCEADAQSWATRCASSDGTPLTVRALELTVERSSSDSHRVKLDARGCKELGEQLAEAGHCGERFKCEDAAAAVETFRARCEKKGEPPTASIGLLELAVLAGADKSVEPMPVQGEKLDPKQLPLSLKDRSGAVLSVCGKRPESLAAYLGARKECSEGALVIAKQFGKDDDTKLRVGRFELTADETFARRFPSLTLAGEQDARDQARLADFISALDKAVQVGPLRAKKKKDRSEAAAEDGVALLIAALDDHADVVRRSESFRTALTSRDAALEPLFVEIGTRKKKALLVTMPEARFVGAARRAQLLPLSDVDREGAVALDAITRAGAIDVAPLLPRSLAAYTEELQGRIDSANKKRLSGGDERKLSAPLQLSAKVCGDSEASIDENERKLLACGFGSETCDAAAIEAATAELDRARGNAELAYPAALLAAAAYGRDGEDAARTVIDSARCLEPWW